MNRPNRFAVIPTPTRLDADPRFTGRGVTIALLDSGFYPHPDLVAPTNRIIAYHDVTNPRGRLRADAPVEDWHWHGTQTSVAAAGNGHLSDGIYQGLASDAWVVLVKVSDNGRISEENIARGLQWVIRNQRRYNIRVVNISLGGECDVRSEDNIVDRAAEEAIRKGIVVVAAAGNSGGSARHHTVPPANAPSVITVGGYDDKNRLGAAGDVDLYWSSYGATADGVIKPEVIAPAMWIAAPILPGTELYERADALSAIAAAPDYLLNHLAKELCEAARLSPEVCNDPPEELRRRVEGLLYQTKIIASGYQHVDGTSFAAPIVTSVVAQMIEANPSLTPEAVKRILVTTATRLNGASLQRQGYGMLNACRAVQEAAEERHHHRLHLLAPHNDRGRHRFTYHNDSARSVALVGDFNNWDAASHPCCCDNHGNWVAEVDALPRGRYGYKFLVDAESWVDDPANGVKADDGHGGWNSVLDVG